MDFAKKQARREKAKAFIKSDTAKPDPQPEQPKTETPEKPKDDTGKKQANYKLDEQLKMDIQIEATRQGIYPAQLVGKVMQKYLDEKKGGERV